mmetsp:Transcript_100947/g.217970  ORF Transcript_100947/g.217970 Transcript_100947/m.217970 type:complete len:187 (-) Transcript_100947:72-632(-)
MAPINKERAQHPNPVNNGGTTELYTWTQSLKDFTLIVPLDESIKSKNIQLDYDKKKFSLKMKGKDYLKDKEWTKEIKTAEFVWTIENNEFTGERTLNIVCEKKDQMGWWESMFVGDQKINLDKIDAETSSLGDLDGETRQTVEKMMYDQRQKQMGKPTSDEQGKHDKIQEFMKAHPEMDFSKAKIM